METSFQFLLTIGGILLVGQAVSTLGKRTRLPRVTLLLILGVVIGRDVLDLLPTHFYPYFELIAQMTLLMVGFLIGGKLTRDSMQHNMAQVVWISVTAAVLTAVVVGLALVVFGLSPELAIVLGCIASATAPAATLDVVMEARSSGRFSQLLISVVALDDAWALLLFAVGLAVAGSLNGQLIESSVLLLAVKDILGAVMLGAVLGFPAAKLTGRLKPGKPILTEALGLVFICGGLALYFEVSFLIAAIVMGAMVANLARHHEFAFHEIENIEWPFVVVFFVMAGATLELHMLRELGLLGLVYIISRIIGKVLGAWLGGQISAADQTVRCWLGWALLPQAGVAIGMALVATIHFPEHRQLLLSLIISSTVFFEVVGPVLSRLAIKRAGEN